MFFVIASIIHFQTVKNENSHPDYVQTVNNYYKYSFLARLYAVLLVLCIIVVMSESVTAGIICRKQCISYCRIIDCR